jgi:cellulose synthase/poly-beta-1,6-N-acetylglucosamine synthase-like glycosyltransferase
VLVAALNEEQVIARKIEDVRRQDYPAELVEVVVVADGSTDRTAEVARALGARVLHDPVARGKSHAVNRGMAAAGGDIVVMTDANCALSSQALRAVAACFADASLAVVGGAKVVHGPGARGAGEGLYWRLETQVKAGEAAFGAVMGAPGELCGVRRSAFRPIPPGVLNDDYHLTCDALVRGYGVGFAPSARAVETVSLSVADELERRSRIAAGTWQTTLRHLRLGDPRRGWVAVAFVSHRVLRSIVTPVLLPLLLAGSAALARRSRVARVLLTLQTAGYALGVAGLRTDHRLAAVPFQFLLTNVATLRGAGRLLLQRQPLVWARAERTGWVDAQGSDPPQARGR